jgi:hypothetical protein
VSIQSSVVCVLSALSSRTRWNRFPDLGGTSFSVSVSQLSLSGKLGGTSFGCWMQHAHVINSLKLQLDLRTFVMCA